jgi:hypothetical protein
MKTTISFLVCGLLSLSSFGQQMQERGIYGQNNWLKGWAEFKPQKVDYPEANKTIPSRISKDYTLTNQHTYLLENKVYVTDGATLTIEEGTIIRCDKASASALIITKGAKIKAEGTVLNPIVFTSNEVSKKAGDWSGIMILGDAPINVIGGEANIGYDVDPLLGKYGGMNTEGSSGSMKYVRIEFAGQKTEVTKKELNGLTLAGVGNKTKIDFVQSSFGLDDGFEFLGGGLTLNNLVSFKNRDDDFDFNLGAQIVINNSQAIRNPFLGSPVAPRAVEIDNYEKKENLDATKKSTSVTLNDVSLINEGAEDEAVKSLKKEAIYINEMCNVTLKKAVISGFKPAIFFNKSIDPKAVNLSKIKIEYLFLHNCDGSISSELGVNYDEDIVNYYAQNQFNNVLDNTVSTDIFKDPKNSVMPDYRMKVDNIK